MTENIIVPSSKKYARTYDREVENPQPISVPAIPTNPDEIWTEEKPTLRGLGKSSTLRYLDQLNQAEAVNAKAKNPFLKTAKEVELKDREISEKIRAGLIEYGVGTSKGISRRSDIPQDIKEEIDYEVHQIMTAGDLEDEKLSLKNLVAAVRHQKDKFKKLQIEGEIFIVLTALCVWRMRNLWDELGLDTFKAWCKGQEGLNFDVGPHTDELIQQAYETAKELNSKKSKRTDAN